MPRSLPLYATSSRRFEAQMVNQEVILCFLIVCVAATPLDDPRYAVVFRQEGSPLEGTDSSLLMPMKLQNGTEYVCVLPAPCKTGCRPEREKGPTYTSGDVLTPQEFRVLDQSLSGLCTVKVDGWWVYDYCWGKGVRQYHNNAQGELETENVLGQTPKKDNAPTPLKFTFETHPVRGAYVSFVLGGGTLCDLTREPREAEVRLTCLDENKAGGEEAAMEIGEVSTCRYVLWWSNKGTCSLRQLRPADSFFDQIECFVKRSADGGEEDRAVVSRD